MDIVLESDAVNRYLDKIQKLKVLSTNDPEKLEKLLDFVLEQKDSIDEKPEINYLFKGEHAFHNGNYEQALINYMQARGVPNFEFFCYRATAYVSFLRGDHEKSANFILKALNFRPFDYDTLKLYHEILTQKGEREKAKEIKDAIEKIESENVESQLHYQNPMEPVEENLDTNTFTQENMASFEESSLTQHSIITENSTHQEETQAMSQSTYTQSTSSETEDFEFEGSRGTDPLSHETTNHFIAAKLGVDLDTEKALETRIQEFQREQNDLICNYLEESKRNRKSQDHSLYILNGWSSKKGTSRNESRELKPASELLLEEQTRQTSGGFYVRWNGKGIAINPGSHFLQSFHEQGLYIDDIHYVIVTHDNPEAHEDIHKIYDLNYQLNKINPELHVIHYYLNHKAYQTLSHTLKPNFQTREINRA